MNARLYLWQRLTAAVMAPMIIIHLVTILYAVGNGLSASEILGRTQGSLLFGGFYAMFVFAAAVHAVIGLRTVAGEWLQLGDRARNGVSILFGLVLIALGLRAVFAVVM